MTHQNPRSLAAWLPLTESAAPDRAPADGVTTQTIRSIVEGFYDKCRRDLALGPVFNERIDDWDRHLSTMRAFWGAAVLRTGGYSGRPLEAHLAIPGLSEQHFARWLQLFQQTLLEQSPPLPPADSALFMSLAQRMAARMSSAVAAHRQAG